MGHSVRGFHVWKCFTFISDNQSRVIILLIVIIIVHNIMNRSDGPAVTQAETQSSLM